jgi:ATP-dependent RNA helicase DeaD
MTAFTEFSLDDRIVAAVTKMGFETATPIQEIAIPVLLEGKDVIGSARTGSGKTAAFGLPMVEKLQEGGKDVRALVLAPTRELAMQVAEQIGLYAKGLPLDVLTIYGGSPYGPQLKALRRGVSIVVGTPGRVIDHMHKGTLDLSHVEILVLDEADEMLRMGFIEPVEEILAACPPDRQIALFSATMPTAIQRMAKRFMKKPILLPVEDDGVEHIEQCYLRVPQRKKMAALVRVLMGTARGTTLVFARTRLSCAKVADDLLKFGIPADAIHGDLNQAARERVIGKLKSKSLRVLVATDVAARGIDISHIGHVINFDLPAEVESYVHRIGRTARAGAKGSAISFITPGEKRRFQNIERTLKVSMIEVFAPNNSDLEALRRTEIWENIKRGLPSEEKPREDMRGWLKTLLESEELSAEDIAVAALGGLLKQHRMPVEEVFAPRDERGGGRDREPREPRGRLSKEDRQTLNEVEVHLAIGSRAGIQIGDIVGAIANESGISGSRIGRISLLDRSTFVGLPKELATKLVSDHPELLIRGVPTKISMARGGDRPNPDFGNRNRKGGLPRFKKGPKMRHKKRAGTRGQGDKG